MVANENLESLILEPQQFINVIKFDIKKALNPFFSFWPQKPIAN